MVFADRRRRAGRYLEWKVGLFSVAAALTVVGMYLEESWMTGAAIAVLAAALSLRFLPGGNVRVHEEGWDDEGWDDEGWDDESGEDDDRDEEDGRGDDGHRSEDGEAPDR